MILVRSCASRAIVAAVVSLAIVLGSLPLRAGETTVPLPVRKVMLFKNGIGYFEHAGEVRGTDPIEPHSSSHVRSPAMRGLAEWTIS